MNPRAGSTGDIGITVQSRLLRTLSHPGRLAILVIVGRGEACVCHLSAALGRSQPYVSQQLAILRDAGLLTIRRQGTFSYYALRDYSVLGIVELAGRLTGRSTPTRFQSGLVDGCTCPNCRPSPAAVRHAR